MPGTAYSSPGERLTQRPSPATELGMRQVRWIRIVVGDDAIVCEVIGTGHRLPVARRVPLRTALTLAAAGVPTVVRAAPGGPGRGGGG